MDRIEFIAARVHDHCEDGDDIARRQMQERVQHVRKTEELLALARGMVELLEDNLRRFQPSIPAVTPHPAQPPRIGPAGRVGQNANGESPIATTEQTRRVSSPR